jgi:hypothetical protein
MVLRLVISSIASISFLISFSAAAQTTPDLLAAEQVRNLVNGKTWALSFQGNLANPATVAYWDFKSDGSVCARFANSKATDRCADDGKWRLQGDELCWDLQRIGETYGYKSVCVRVRKVDEKRYEAIAQDGRMAPAAFYPVK